MAPALNETIGRLVQLARERNARDLIHGHERGLYYDEAAAQRAVDFFSYLRHSKGEWAGFPFKLAAWQEHDIIRPLFGWKRADGFRRFRTAYLATARKSGKSTLAAGIGLYLTLADGERGAEVYSAATKKDQAKIIHAEAMRMVRASKSLREWVQLFRDNISVVRTGSKYEPLGADADTLDGLNTHAAIIDELHAHKGRELWDILDTSTGARRQPLMLATTTAGFNRLTICWEIHNRAVQVLEEALEDDTLFAYIASIDPEDDWRNPECWIKANPNLGITPKLETLQQACSKAETTPAFQNTFRRLHLNEWTEQSERAIDMVAWRECAGKIDEAELAGKECYGGLDLASTMDLTAASLTFPWNGRHFKLLWKFWLPAAALDSRDKRNRAQYLAWAREGWLKIVPGNVMDYDVVRADLAEWKNKFNILEMSFDPWNAKEIAGKMQDDGFTMVEHRQGFISMSEPTKSFMGLILDRDIEHGNNPIATWMAANFVVATDPSGNLKPDKAKSSEKIDGMVAAIMGTARALLSVGPSVYEERGIVVL